MNGESQGLSLGDAASRFLVSLSPKKREMSQQEVCRFARWYGWERPFTGLAAPDIAGYAQRLSLSDTDYTKKLELIRAPLFMPERKGGARVISPFISRPGKGELPLGRRLSGVRLKLSV